ncbi:MAG TPA: zinc ribbon domain-containing protein, partial [Pyrinomonadaceae bacterium]|nr:zinc ribbon domain-containing protein [Pyrinomonadaceae bacterium]
MYCPRCAAENIEDASFCRSCGADIRLVPQALSGTLASVTAGEGDVESAAGRRRRKKKEEDGPPSKAKGIENIFLGVGFLFVSLAIWAFMPGG